MPSLRTLRILIVDDDPGLAEVCAVVLGMDGHACQIASSGSRALTALTELAPHVVFVDLGLPDITGFELASAIRSRAPHVRLIALTGWRHNDDPFADPVFAVFDRCIEKPARAETLRTVVRDLDITDQVASG